MGKRKLFNSKMIVNKTPVVIDKISKRSGGFTIFMKAPTEQLEWYFSKGLTNILVMQGKKAPYIRIDEILEFLKEFKEDELTNS